MSFSYLRIIVFVFMFQVEIKVHANSHDKEPAHKEEHKAEHKSKAKEDHKEEPADEHKEAHAEAHEESHEEVFKVTPIVQIPENCATQNISCAINSYEGRARLSVGPASLELGTKTSMVKSAKGDVLRLLKGNIGLLAGDQEILLKTDHVEIYIEGKSRVHIERNFDQTLVRVLRGTVRVISKDGGQRWTLAAGFQNWYGRIDQKGLTKSGIVAAVEKKWLGDDVVHLRSVASIADTYQTLVEKDNRLEEEKARKQAELERQEQRLHKKQKEQFLRRVLYEDHSNP